MTFDPSPPSEERAAVAAPSRLRDLELQPVFVILSSLALFTIFWYFGRRPFYQEALWGYFADGSDLQPLYPFFYFCFASVFFRMLVPMLCIKLVLKKNLSEFGFSLRGSGQAAWIYLALFVAMVPLVVYASTTPAFQDYYPQFKEVIHHGTVKWEHVLAFELIYGLLFMSGESFWRGYIIFGLEKRFGYYGILIMVIPYVMSHYEKPFLETMGAIVAGSVLGVLALKHRNFWLGVLVHWGVAMFMDLMALQRAGVEIV